MRKNSGVSLGASALAAIAIIVVVGFSVFAATNLNSSRSTTVGSTVRTSGRPSIITSISTGASSVSAETTNSSLGLELLLSVNSTTIPSEDAISVSASIMNMLATANNLTSAYDWAVQGLSAGPCDLGNSTNKLFSPIGFAVFRGSYGLNNISSASRPLPVWPNMECIVDMAYNGSKMVGYLENITSYSIFPKGANNLGNDSGNYAGYYIVPSSPQTCNSTTCTYYQTPDTFAKGVFSTRFFSQAAMYAANGTGFFNSLNSSLPSTYTLVAGDEWGQIVLMHFRVVASSNLPTVGDFLAFGGCFENSSPTPCIVSHLSDAMIFNCASEAATSSGCTIRGNLPPGQPLDVITNYTITVWYPDTNQPNEPTQYNCMYNVLNNRPASSFGYCFMVNSTAFAISFSSI